MQSDSRATGCLCTVLTSCELAFCSINMSCCAMGDSLAILSRSSKLFKSSHKVYLSTGLLAWATDYTASLCERMSAATVSVSREFESPTTAAEEWCQLLAPHKKGNKVLLASCDKSMKQAATSTFTLVTDKVKAAMPV